MRIFCYLLIFRLCTACHRRCGYGSRTVSETLFKSCIFISYQDTVKYTEASDYGYEKKKEYKRPYQGPSLGILV